jgi:pantetheine-phosphate adenylyltransferase
MMAIAVYAGTFDPVTAGHLSVVGQAARVFDHLRVLVAVNPDKTSLFSPEERVEMIRDAVSRLPNVSVDGTSSLVVEYAREIGATFLVRSIRGATDSQFETELAQTNRLLAPDIITLLLPAEAHLSVVSSSALKARVARGEDVSGFCTPAVADRLRRRLAAGAGAGR